VYAPMQRDGHLQLMETPGSCSAVRAVEAAIGTSAPLAAHLGGAFTTRRSSESQGHQERQVAADVHAPVFAGGGFSGGGVFLGGGATFVWGGVLSFWGGGLFFFLGGGMMPAWFCCSPALLANRQMGMIEGIC